MNDLTPIFERVDGALQCSIGLGDLVYADNPICFTPALWVRVTKWQTTLDGDLLIEGTVDQPTETAPGSYEHGQIVLVRGSRVFEHVLADKVVDKRIENFFADDSIPPPGLAPEDPATLLAELRDFIESLHKKIDMIIAAGSFPDDGR